MEYEAWKEQNPNQDFSQKEYQQTIVNTRAFEYESIRDTQENKEFWFQIGALVVIIGATLICPPAGMALGAVYGTYELSSAVSGKDLVSGRELETSERWVRGLLAPLDIVPGVSGLTKFSSTIRLASVSDNIGKLGLSSGVKGGIQQGASRISNLVETASKFGTDRLRRAEAAFQNGANIVKNKVIKETIEVAQVADKVATGAKNLNPLRIKLVEDTMGNKVLAHDLAVNTHSIENGLRDYVSRIEGVKVGSGGTRGIKGTVKGKGVSETNLRNIDDFINGNKKFDEVIEDYAKVYKEHVDLNKPWSWDDTIPGGDCLSSAQKRKIKEMAIEKGHISEIKVTKVEGMRYGFADFASAGVVEETVQLPEKFWKLSDKEQFKWLDEQIGGTRKGMTWHHTEVPGRIELVPFGIHNITPHNGGRTKGMWADAPR
ncbi:HNH endonuclease [Bacillus marasmi]|uniref:HNH endonuclease n=1 Tax=Bacillus marasmi TaxID=1926279 RepID=UPI001FE78962|nr:HNH endonuclease [Bacillus marasmi]